MSPYYSVPPGPHGAVPGRQQLYYDIECPRRPPGGPPVEPSGKRAGQTAAIGQRFDLGHGWMV